MRNLSERAKIGLALGAGAARGLAHIGVLEVMEEHNIPIDIIAGSSMGAVIGCMFANGTSAKMIHGLAAQICGIDYRKLFDITLPHTGLIRGQRIDTVIRTLIGDRSFDQLKIPFAAVSACLEDGTARVFDTGKVANAVRASISIPGVFEPVKIDGKTYVDGGVLDRVPAGVARSMGADIVIAVDVGYRGEPRATPVSIIDVMISSFELQEWESMRNRLVDADITIVPDTRTMNPAMFNQVEECVEKGRTAALAVIDNVKAIVSAAEVKYLADA
jgi:NTE family protein